MTEMIERVAKALWDDRNPDTEWNDIEKLSYLGHARAAIEAMPEPTSDILNAGDSMMPQIAKGEDITTGYDALQEAWPAMIDQALAELGPQRDAGTADEHGVPRAEE